MANQEHPYQSLAYYEAKAKTMTDAALDYAISDVARTLDAWTPDTDTPYTRKLWAEWDAYTVERRRRRDAVSRVRMPRLM